MFIKDQEKNKVERIIGEVKRGVPIILYDNTSYLLFSAAELLSNSLFDWLKHISTDIYTTVTMNKVNYSFSNTENGNKRLFINCFDDIVTLLTFHEKQYTTKLENAQPIDEYATSILKLAELLPYAIVIDMKFQCYSEMHNWCKENDIFAMHRTAIDKYSNNHDVYEVCRTPLILKHAMASTIISYRAYNRRNEHYAIIVGELSTCEPLVRIHSSCYTGDLLDSLSCDCRSQLQMSFQMISNAGCGIIIYLMQEGRGIGLINKLRAYNLQTKHGLDTVDANHALGFNDDERNFSIAAKILETLKVKKLKLLTNNPRKLAALKNYGIEVTSRLTVIPERNQYSAAYIKTKFNRLGHMQN